jgi:hypothetical protein
VTSLKHFNPADEYHKYEQADAERLGAEPWQIELVKLNPEYCGWVEYTIEYGSWGDFGPWHLDDLNELAAFYFTVDRDNEECPVCLGNGYHEKAQQVVRTFYQHSCHRGETEWCDKITQDELDYLIEKGRINEGASLSEVNLANSPGRPMPLGGRKGVVNHDGINRCYLIEKRLERLGLPKVCENCEGHGYVFTSPTPRVDLALWIRQPRKERSHRVLVKHIQKDELGDVREFLAKGAKRVLDQFSVIEKIGG